MIDENILIEKIIDNSKNVGDEITNLYMKSGYKLAHEHIMDIIHLMQTRSKQPISAGTVNCNHTMHPVIPPLKPVVLCKDCSFWDKFLGLKYCRKNHVPANENDFCSFGKRKD